jgi:hypothetical protein
VLDSADLAGGFEFGGDRIPLINPQRGIFKPRQMEHLLSVKTVFPRRGARVWYDDQREAHRQIYAGGDVVDYQFMGTDPNSPDNRWLLNAMQQQIPVIYFLGTSPGRYQPIIPTFVVGWHPERLRVDLAFGVIVGASAQAVPPDPPERRYALREMVRPHDVFSKPRHRRRLIRVRHIAIPAFRSRELSWAPGVTSGKASDSRPLVNKPHIRVMDGMILAHLSRIVLRGIALVLGSLGVFCLYWSFVGVAIICLGSVTAIILASDSESRAGR